MAQTVVALYDDLEAARAAVEDLRQAGIAQSSISVLLHDPSGRYAETLAPRAAGGAEAEGAATGAGIGAVLGGLGGLLVGLGALTIPGIGPVLAAGPLGTTLAALLGAGAGMVAGGAAGGLLGALVDIGVPEDEAGYYAEAVRRGGALVAVEADDVTLEQARSRLSRHNPVDVRGRAAGWRQSGWTGYSPSSAAYSPGEAAREREQWRAAAVGAGGDEGQLPREGAVRTYHRGERSGASPEQYRMAWRGHYQTHFAHSGYGYEHYEPAYDYGVSLGRDDRFRDRDWRNIEPEARRVWESRYPTSTWKQVQDAVRYGWEYITAAVRD